MNEAKLKAYLQSEESRAFEGWDFSYLSGRWTSQPLPWNYKTIVQTYLESTHQLLDMGTGGGEFLLSLGHPHALTAVTEAYPPNVALCRRRLQPLGIKVIEADGAGALPFADASMDIVINRHEDFDADELARILKPGGVFVTQQVGGRNMNALSAKLIGGFVPAYPDHDMESNKAKLEAAGLETLLVDEALGALRFLDLGALVYYAKIIEWEFPGFSVEECFEALLALKKELDETGYIEGTEHRLIIAARKKAQ